MGCNIGFRKGDHQLFVFAAAPFVGGKDFNIGLDYRYFLPSTLKKIETSLSFSPSYGRMTFISGAGAISPGSYNLVFQSVPIVTWNVYKGIHIYGGFGLSANYLNIIHQNGEAYDVKYLSGAAQGGIGWEISLQRTLIHRSLENDTVGIGTSLQKHSLDMLISLQESSFRDYYYFYQINYRYRVGKRYEIGTGVEFRGNDRSTTGFPLKIFGPKVSLWFYTVQSHRFSHFIGPSFGTGKRDYWYTATSESWPYFYYMLENGANICISNRLYLTASFSYRQFWAKITQVNTWWDHKIEFNANVGLRYEFKLDRFRNKQINEY